MPHRVLKRVFLPIAIIASLAVVAPVAAAAERKGLVAPATVHLRGTVYTFDNQNPIEGATVGIAEVPGASAVSLADGSYDIAVPDGSKLTPYVTAPGHHGIHLQTFVTKGADIERVNFQIPTTGTYGALAGLLGAQLDPNGELVNCAIVSTFANEAVRDLSFDEFVAFGAHGVAGATASTTPALPGPIYFNESVIPDPSKTESSIDGGVIWTEVPEGNYRVRAQHATERFAEFDATCLPGRLVNANPPQGLYQLRAGEQLDTAVEASLEKARFRRVGKHGRVLRLKTASPEYVSVDALLTRKAKTLAQSEPGDGIGDFVPGTRKLVLKVKRSAPAGKVKVAVTFTDAAGNAETVVERLRLPEKKG